MRWSVLGASLLLLLLAHVGIFEAFRGKREKKYPCVQGWCTCYESSLSTCKMTVNCSGMPENYRGNLTSYVRQMHKNTCSLEFDGFHGLTFNSKAWEHFTNLKVIKFINASIVDVEEFFTTAKTKIKENINSLYLNSNSIRSISGDTFQHFLALKTLYLRHNGIETLEAVHFWYLQNLTHLGLQQNRLQRLESGRFSNLTRLNILHLEMNFINFIHRDAFKGLDNLEEIYLNYNNLTAIDPGTFALSRLRIMHLPLLGMCNATDGNGGAAKRPNSILLCSCLPSSFEYNKIKVLTKSILEAPLLNTVHLSHNLIEVIRPEAIPELINIKVWSLDNNSLASIPDAVIEKHDFTSVLQQPEIILMKNPFICDCHITRLWLLLKERREKNKSSTYHLTCTYPGSKNVSNIEDIYSSSLTCNNDSVIMAEPCYRNENKTYNPESCKHLQKLLCSSANSNSSCICGFEKNCFVCPDKYYGTHNYVPYRCSPCSNLKSGGYGAQYFSQCQCLPGFEEIDNKCQECPHNTSKAELGPQPCSPCKKDSEIWHSVTKCNCSKGYVESPGGICQVPVTDSLWNISKPGPQTESNNLVDITSQDTIVIIIITISSGFTVFVIIFSVLLYRLTFKNKLKRHEKEHELAMNNILHNINIPRATENTYINADAFNGLLVDFHQIKIEQLLGQGAFGLVHKASVEGLKNATGITTVAIKTLKDGHTEEDKAALYSELQQLHYVGHHPNIINLLGFVSNDEKLMLIIEYASHGDLLSYLKGKSITTQYASLQFCNESSTLSSYLDMDNSPYMQPNSLSSPPEGNNNSVALKTLLAIAWQVTKGMSHLAEMKCIHRDLAGRNVLLSSGLVAKVSDFGLARAVYESGYYFKETKGRLPFKWMAMEAILDGQYTTKSDVWSFGILLWEIFTLGSNPYPGVPIKGLTEILQAGYRMTKPSKCPADVYEIMQNCWHERPCERPNFEELANSLEKLLQKTENSDYIEIHAGINDGDLSCPSPIDNDEFVNQNPYDCLLSERERLQHKDSPLPLSPVRSSAYAQLFPCTLNRISENSGLLS